MPRKPLSEEDKKARSIIANNLKKITHGYTRAQLSDMTGIPVTTLSGYFTEKSTISMENAELIAKAFNVDKSDIDPRYSREYNYYDLKKEVLDELQENNKSFVADKFVELAEKANAAGMTLNRTKTDRGNIMTVLSSDIQEYNFLTLLLLPAYLLQSKLLIKTILSKLLFLIMPWENMQDIKMYFLLK